MEKIRNIITYDAIRGFFKEAHWTYVDDTTRKLNIEHHSFSDIAKFQNIYENSSCLLHFVATVRSISIAPVENNVVASNQRLTYASDWQNYMLRTSGDDYYAHLKKEAAKIRMELNSPKFADNENSNSAYIDLLNLYTTIQRNITAYESSKKATVERQ